MVVAIVAGYTVSGEDLQSFRFKRQGDSVSTFSAIQFVINDGLLFGFGFQFVNKQ